MRKKENFIGKGFVSLFLSLFYSAFVFKLKAIFSCFISFFIFFFLLFLSAMFHSCHSFFIYIFSLFLPYFFLALFHKLYSLCFIPSLFRYIFHSFIFFSFLLLTHYHNFSYSLFIINVDYPSNRIPCEVSTSRP